MQEQQQRALEGLARLLADSDRALREATRAVDEEPAPAPGERRPYRTAWGLEVPDPPPGPTKESFLTREARRAPATADGEPAGSGSSTPDGEAVSAGEDLGGRAARFLDRLGSRLGVGRSHGDGEGEDAGADARGEDGEAGEDARGRHAEGEDAQGEDGASAAAPPSGTPDPYAALKARIDELEKEREGEAQRKSWRERVRVTQTQWCRWLMEQIPGDGGEIDEQADPMGTTACRYVGRRGVAATLRFGREWYRRLERTFNATWQVTDEVTGP
jgi:hypothetical protein